MTRCLFFVLTHLHFNNLINCYLSCCLHIVASLVCKRESVWLPDTDEVSQFQAETTCSNACCLCQRQNLRSTSGKWLWVVVFLQLYLYFSPVNVSHESMSNWPSWWHHGWENLYLLFSDKYYTAIALHLKVRQAQFCEIWIARLDPLQTQTLSQHKFPKKHEYQLDKDMMDTENSFISPRFHKEGL